MITLSRGRIIPQSLATEMAVSMLSPREQAENEHVAQVPYPDCCIPKVSCFALSKGGSFNVSRKTSTTNGPVWSFSTCSSEGFFTILAYETFHKAWHRNTESYILNLEFVVCASFTAGRLHLLSKPD